MKKRYIVLILILALLCIGGVELAACRHFAPELYEQITRPVAVCVNRVLGAASDLGQQASQLGQRALAQASQAWDNFTAPKAPPPEEELESQLAGSPALENDTPISDPSITELIDQDGQSILTGGIVDIVYFNQGEAPWAEQPYGSDHIGGYGCGPAAMAMAVASLTGEETDPALMAQWAVDHGYWARRSGSYLSIVEGTASAYGLVAEPLTNRTTDALMEALFSGKILVALMGPGHFTQHGHFILLRGVTLSGDILVADPNSTERSLTVWDPQLILDELSTSTSNGAPLWTLCAAPG